MAESPFTCSPGPTTHETLNRTVLRPRLVETGSHDRRIKIVRHDNVPHAAQKPDRPDVRA